MASESPPRSETMLQVRRCRPSASNDDVDLAFANALQDLVSGEAPLNDDGARRTRRVPG